MNRHGRLIVTDVHDHDDNGHNREDNIDENDENDDSALCANVSRPPAWPMLQALGEIEVYSPHRRDQGCQASLICIFFHLQNNSNIEFTFAFHHNLSSLKIQY